MKHAYLIIAHNEFDLLEKQMRLLDDPRNDFFIHIDKKVKDFPFDTFHHFLKHSHVHYVDRLDIRWGDFNMVRCELRLLEAAVKGNYRYYHLLSGVDLPLKSNDEIHQFFAENDGKELVQFWPTENPNLKIRTDRYHFVHLRTSRNAFFRRVGEWSHWRMDALCRRGFCRKWDPHRTFAYGGQWFSITHQLALYILTQKKWIHRQFFMTSCADELFVQCVVADSAFIEKVYYPQRVWDCWGNMRYVDWERSNGNNPWTFGSEDYELLIHSPCLFARKFSTQVDERIIEDIYRYVSGKNADLL